MLAEVTIDRLAATLRTRARDGHADAAAIAEQSVRRFADAVLGHSRCHLTSMSSPDARSAQSTSTTSVARRQKRPRALVAAQAASSSCGQNLRATTTG